ncbi:MAG: hypothetical protein SCL54_16670 [Bacillota bacterium]|nr:hypothetical protein [Bacillota bacterium]
MIDRWIEKFGKRKLFFMLLTSILIIGIVIAGAKEYYSMRFKIGDQGFIYDRTENRKTYFVDDEGQSLIAFADGYGTFITSNHQDVIIQYKNQTIKKTIDHDSEKPIKIYLDEELIHEGEWNDDETSYYRALMTKVIDKSIYFQNGLLTYKIFIFIIFGLIISVSIVYPEAIWLFQYMLVVKSGEPTEFYILTLRITGVVLSFLLIRIAFL